MEVSKVMGVPHIIEIEKTMFVVKQPWWLGDPPGLKKAPYVSGLTMTSLWRHDGYWWLGSGESSPSGRMITAIFRFVNYYNSARQSMYLTNEHMGYLRTMTRILNLMAFAWLLGFHGRTAPLQWYLGLQHGFQENPMVWNIMFHHVPCEHCPCKGYPN